MKLRALSFVVVACVGLTPHRLAFGQCQYEVTVLPEIQCPFWVSRPPPAGINNLSHVAAYSDCGNGPQPVLWTGGDQWTFLPLPAGFDEGQPHALNDLDEVVGEAVDTVALPGGGTLSTTYACLWRPGRPPRLLGIPAGGNYSIATGINNHSEICGYWGNFNTGVPTFRPFTWRAGIMTDLAVPNSDFSRLFDISDDGYIAGTSGETTETFRAFRWHDGDYLDLGPIPGGISGRAHAAADNGLVAGWGVLQIKNEIHIRRGAVWHNGAQNLIPVLPETNSGVLRDANRVAGVGYCFNAPASSSRAFLYQDRTSHDLTALAGVSLVASADGINENGQIVGIGIVDDNAVLLLTPIGSAPADVTRNCVVNLDDLLAVISEWGLGASYADIDCDNVVGVSDLLLVIEQWGP